MTGRIVAISLSMTLCVAISACDGSRQGASQAPPSAEAPLSITEVRFIGLGDSADGYRNPQYADRPVRVQIRSKGQGKGEVLHAKLIELANGTPVGLREHAWRAHDETAVMEFESESGMLTPGRYLLELTMQGKLVSHHNIDVFPSEQEDN